METDKLTVLQNSARIDVVTGRALSFNTLYQTAGTVAINPIFISVVILKEVE